MVFYASNVLFLVVGAQSKGKNMDVEIKSLSGNTEDGNLLRRIFRVRYLVYHDEMGLTPANSKREVNDGFDYLDSTINFLALHQGRPVGALRLVEWSEKGFYMDDVFGNELKTYRDEQNLRESGCAELSRFVVLKEYRGLTSCVTAHLVAAIYSHCTKNNIEDIFIAANPEKQRLYQRAGFRAIGQPRVYPAVGRPGIPMHMKISGLSETAKARVMRVLNSRGFDAM
jgi:N-acyl-L-homoserine lactone synthetase